MIKILTGGYDSRHDTAFEIYRKIGPDNHVLLLLKTEVYFHIQDRSYQLKPNMAMLLEPFVNVRYGSSVPGFTNDWIHFDLREEPDFLKTLRIPCNTPVPLPEMSALSNYVRLLMQERHLESPHSEEIQDSLMHLLLYQLDNQINQPGGSLVSHKHYPAMARLRTNLYNNPHGRWTVERMADSVHLSTSYFQHLYRDLFGISCVQDLIRARLENAKHYLTNTDMTILELSGFCGYENELHFMRQFKKFEGMTPTQYRILSRK